MGMEQVVQGAQLTCSFGMTPAVLTVTSNFRVTCQNMASATTQDFAPMTNIPAFGMCTTPSNPAVAAATSAAMGALTPAPCVPATTAPWTPPASRKTVGSLPALLKAATCLCTWGGVITITSSGQMPPKTDAM